MAALGLASLGYATPFRGGRLNPGAGQRTVLGQCDPNVSRDPPMSNPSQPDSAPHVFISAAEPSADGLGAGLIRAVRAQVPGARFTGVAGPRMVDAGCEPIFDMTSHSAMLLGAVRAVGRAWSMLRACGRCLTAKRFDAAVLIDSPALHLRLAKRVNAAGVPLLYYVAPQLWAWGAKRISQVRERVSHLAALLPFEEAYFQERGVPTTFVGHPMFDPGEWTEPAAERVAAVRAAGSPVIALLPGSRKHVVREVLPGQLAVAERVAEAFPTARFGVSVAGPAVAKVVDQLATRCAVEVQRFDAGHAELMAAADLVLVASGTTTLEVAGRGKPMIVMYNASRVMYHLVARWLVKTPHLSLPNILAGRAVVPEFMPYYTSPEPIAERAIELLRDAEEREQMTRDLADVIAPMRTGNASERVAGLLLEMAGGQTGGRLR